MPQITFDLDTRALAFAEEQAEEYELESAKVYLTALLHGAINHEMAREEDYRMLPPILPAVVIYPRHVRDDDEVERRIEVSWNNDDIPF